MSDFKLKTAKAIIGFSIFAYALYLLHDIGGWKLILPLILLQTSHNLEKH